MFIDYFKISNIVTRDQLTFYLSSPMDQYLLYSLDQLNKEDASAHYWYLRDRSKYTMFQ